MPLSSRNAYLAPSSSAGRVLPQALALGQELLAAGQRQAEPLLQAVRALMEDGGLAVDYLQLVDLPRLQVLEQLTGPALLAAAVRCGEARLIDHRVSAVCQSLPSMVQPVPVRAR